MDALVTTGWLADRVDDPDLVLLDATYFLPADGRDAGADHRSGHLPGALFLDLAAFADPASALPMMLPPPAQVADRLAALGVHADRRVILYDASPYHSAARAWWMLARLGMSRVALLDGGLAAWRAEGRPVVTDVVRPHPGTSLPPLDPAPDLAPVRSLADMRAIVRDGGVQVVDARSAPRFTGEEPETRANSASGHIPGSRNLPYKQLFRPDGTWKRGNELRAAFAAAGVDLDQPIVTTCGSGITAAVLVFALHLLGRDAALYDGSWSEWGALPDTPKAVGPA